MLSRRVNVSANPLAPQRKAAGTLICRPPVSMGRSKHGSYFFTDTVTLHAWADESVMRILPSRNG
jgi:hypothetical protein